MQCTECEEGYMEQTKRYLRKRMRENLNTGKKPRVKYSPENCHPFNFENVKILPSENEYHKRFVPKMINSRYQQQK